MRDSSLALLSLGRALGRAGYRFVTPTPETHRRVIARRDEAHDLRDVFGWSRRFAPELLPAELRALLERAEAAEHDGAWCRSGVRFSTLGGALYVHSAYPTKSADAVFFGPDTYRFCAFLARACPAAHYVVDVGCGSGAGGLVAARAAGAERCVLADVNDRALALAEINARLQDRAVSCVASDVLSAVEGTPDLIVANPPYMRDHEARMYRDGGGRFGEALSVRIVRESLARLAPGGTLLLYTGAPIVDGRDVFFEAVAPLLRDAMHTYEELDPDVFGEELEQPGYELVERIAAVGLKVVKA
jgi:methylase of polypeptide subunit release factors